MDLAGGLPSVSAVGLPDAAVREGIERIRSAIPHAGFVAPRRPRDHQPRARRRSRSRGPGSTSRSRSRCWPRRGRSCASHPDGHGDRGELDSTGPSGRSAGRSRSRWRPSRAGRRRVLVPRANAAGSGTRRGSRWFRSAPSPTSRRRTGRDARVARRTWPRCCARRRRAGRPTTSPTFAARRSRGAPSRSPRPAGTTCCFRGRRDRGRACWRSGSPGSCPAMTPSEALEVTRVWSAAGLARGLVATRPFRAPHHGISFAGLTGGGCDSAGGGSSRRTASCTSTRCRSSAGTRSKRCASPSRTGRSPWCASTRARPSRAASCSSRR